MTNIISLLCLLYLFIQLIMVLNVDSKNCSNMCIDIYA